MNIQLQSAKLPKQIYVRDHDQNQKHNFVIIQMMDDGGDKQFISDEVIKVVDDSINNLFGIKEGELDKNVNFVYNKEKATSQTNQVIDLAIRGLCKLDKPFKYCVTAIMMQNNGAQIDTALLGYYDANTDGTVSIRRDIGDYTVIVSVFAMLI